MITIAVVFSLFAFVHSITVAGPFKDLCRRLFGERFLRVWYRFLYSLVSVLTAAAAFKCIADLPDELLWQAPAWLAWYLQAVRVGALVFGAAAFRHLDGMEFLGVKQVWRYITARTIAGDGEGLTANGLITSGVYGIVRHPLYLAGIIFFTFRPDMTANGLIVAILADLYFVFGVFMEERRFLRIFGDDYRRYRNEVPMLFPKLHSAL